jgi:hypothetical protein
MHRSRRPAFAIPQSAFLFGALLLMVCGSAAQAATAEEDKPVRSISRVYDIRDLLMQRKAYPAQSALVPPTRIGEPRPVAEVRAATTRPTNASDDVAKQLMDLIQETVDPDSWRENGGTVGAIRELQGQLIVTQTSENQALLMDLLKQLRETSARMVTIRAHWIFLKPADLKSVVKPSATDPALFVVDLDAVDKLADRATKHYQGQVTCFNTQTVNVTSGNARTVVWGMVSNTGGGANSVAYDPQSSIVQAGMLLEVTPVLTPDGSTVMLDLQSVASDWGGFTGNPGSGPRPTTRPASGPPDIDHVQMLVQQLRTSVALPVGKPILVGGMTYTPWFEGEDDGQLYLVIEADALPNTAEADQQKDKSKK